MADIDLRADCGRCAALCCVALFFDKSDAFAIDKRAAEPCPNLAGSRACTIYGERLKRGFSGCVGYDCHGAGQRVTQDLFGGRDWADDPALLAPMSAAFGTVARAHRLLVVLREAKRLPLAKADRSRLDTLARAVAAAGAEEDAVTALEAEVARFLQSLRRYLAREAGPRA